VADAEVTLFKPDDTKVKLKTDQDGRTEPIPGVGRYAAWARTTETKAGELDGHKYEEIRHYATLVFDRIATPTSSQAPVTSPYPPLPVAVSSLGAVVCDGYLYVYGGHAGQTHSYDTQSVLGTFHRLKLDGGTTWEELPGGPIAQGLNLVAHNGKIYRVGGMSPRNLPGEPADNHSLTDVARFDPATRIWEQLPPLPMGRSSHDVVIVGDTLVVVGGWCSRGRGSPALWHDTTLVLDLAATTPQWQSLPQPFQRRALTAAARDGKVYVMGGLTPDGGTQKRTDILDLSSGTWTTGPELPGTPRVAFSPAAAVINNQVILNTSAGMTYRLQSDERGWQPIGPSQTHRMVARLVAKNHSEALLVGGASRAGNIGAIEVIRVEN
jgi:N-acetylneuraminic acid mutarotase